MMPYSYGDSIRDLLIWEDTCNCCLRSETALRSPSPQGGRRSVCAPEEMRRALIEQESRYQSIDDTIVQLFISQASALIGNLTTRNEWKKAA